MKNSLAVVLAFAAIPLTLSSAFAQTVSTVINNPTGALITVARCSDYLLDYTPNSTHAQHSVEVSTTPASQRTVIEFSLIYRDGRSASWLVPMKDYSQWVTQKLTISRSNIEYTAMRCAVAFGADTSGKMYVAPWLDIAFPDLYDQNHRTPIAPVPEP